MAISIKPFQLHRAISQITNFLVRSNIRALSFQDIKESQILGIFEG